VRGVIAAFVDKMVTDLQTARPSFGAPDHFPFGLFVAGAVEAAVETNQLGGNAVREFLEAALRQSGLADDAVTAFLRDWAQDDNRPRFRRMMDEGKTALAIHLGEPPPSDHLSLAQLLTRWHDTAAAATASERQDVTLLLTDIVGSTALTSQIGNAGAQRVVRAHNSIVRAAAKAFRGREVKHTGDGMLLAFPDAGTAARAAIDIQQESCNFADANPTAPLSLRIGLHTGEALLEDGEYYGPAVAAVNGVCAHASANEIACTAVLRRKLPAALKVEDMGQLTFKGSAERIGVFKLLWEPKRAKTKSVLEYRQIGNAPGGGETSGPR
jgi:adenylate cyclase